MFKSVSSPSGSVRKTRAENLGPEPVSAPSATGAIACGRTPTTNLAPDGDLGSEVLQGAASRSTNGNARVRFPPTSFNVAAIRLIGGSPTRDATNSSRGSVY